MISYLLIRSAFPDSKVASSYHSASTKATCMLNLAVAPLLVESLVESMSNHPFSLSIDGSNDSGLKKMTVRIFDYEANRLSTRFLDTCTTSSSTAESLFTALNTRLKELLQTPNPWAMCTSIGVDNLILAFVILSRHMYYYNYIL